MALRVIPPNLLTIQAEDGTKIVVDKPGNETALLEALIKARVGDMMQEIGLEYVDLLERCNSFTRIFVGLILVGMKIDAIKFHREVMKSGLKEAKDCAEEVERHLGASTFHGDGSINWPIDSRLK